MAQKYKRILVPYDGSKYSEKALEEAAMISKVCNSTIFLLNVVNESVFKEHPSLFSGYIRGTKNNDENLAYKIIDQTENSLERICFDLSKKGIKMSHHVISGIPKKEILKFIKDNKIDLVVIGSQGLGGIKKLKILGSVSRAIVENALCPVLVVH